MKVWDKKAKGMAEFTPSPIGGIIAVKADGSKYKHPANRAERRRLIKEERRIQKHEHNTKKGSYNTSETTKKGDGETPKIKR